MAGPSLHDLGYTAARQAYVAAVRNGEGPSMATKAIIDAYVNASRPRAARRTGSEVLAGMPSPIRHLVIRIAHKCGLAPDFVACKYVASPDHSRAVHSACRAEIWRTLYATGRYSYPQIGAWFHVDHSTVQHAVKGGPQRTPYINHTMRRPPHVR